MSAFIPDRFFIPNPDPERSHPWYWCKVCWRIYKYSDKDKLENDACCSKNAVREPPEVFCIMLKDGKIIRMKKIGEEKRR